MLNRHTLVLALALGACLTLPSLADSEPGEAVYSSLDEGRLKDDLKGTLPAASDEARVALYASPGTKLSATLTPNDEFGAAATGVDLTLCKADGTEIPVTGTKADKSKEGKDAVKWKNVRLEEDGDYVLIVRVTGPGGFRLKVGGKLAAIVTEDASTEPLFSNAETSVDFEGLGGGKVKVELRATKDSKFVGELHRIEQEDGTVVWDYEDNEGEKIVLEVDGLHRAIFANAGNFSGDWKAKITAKAPKVYKRKGFMRADGTWFAPKVQNLDPDKGINIDTQRDVTMTGRDFQEGLDIRLQRADRPDIIATGVHRMSETEVKFTLDLDTRNTQSQNSTGKWKVAVTNGPEYSTPDDPTTLDKDTPARNTKKTFSSVKSGSVQLPDGVEEDTEVWFIDFNGEFQDDLDAMGLGSEDADVRRLTRNAVEAYIIAFLRDLNRINESNGNVTNKSVPICFIVDRPTAVAGVAGEDYNRIEVGGTWEAGDPQDPDEPLAWGFAPFDEGNQVREDLTLEAGEDPVVRLGLGVRTGILDPSNASTGGTWKAAMQPLRSNPLGAGALIYFAPNFVPANQAQADRYADIVAQIERASREIAALIAHQVGKSMGVDDGGVGPMANPVQAGEFWVIYADLQYGDSDITTFQQLAVPSDLPGKSDVLGVGFFPMNPTRPYLLDNCTTDVPYTQNLELVGGRPNALPVDYFVQASSRFPLGLGVSITSRETGLVLINGTAPLYIATNQFYCNLAVFAIRVTDTRRSTQRTFRNRINVLANVPLLPVALQNEASTCNTTIQQAP